MYEYYQIRNSTNLVDLKLSSVNPLIDNDNFSYIDLSTLPLDFDYSKRYMLVDGSLQVYEEPQIVSGRSISWRFNAFSRSAAIFKSTASLKLMLKESWSSTAALGVYGIFEIYRVFDVASWPGASSRPSVLPSSLLPPSLPSSLPSSLRVAP